MVSHTAVRAAVARTRALSGLVLLVAPPWAPQVVWGVSSGLCCARPRGDRGKERFGGISGHGHCGTKKAEMNSSGSYKKENGFVEEDGVIC